MAKATRAVVPEAVLIDDRLNAGAVHLYAVLALQTDHCWPSQKTLAAWLGWTGATVSRRLKTLREAGWVDVVDGTFVVRDRAA